MERPFVSKENSKNWKNEFSKGPFDLELSLFCGQAFRWIKDESSFLGVVKENLIEVKQSKNQINWRILGSLQDRPEFDAIHYFSLNIDFDECLTAIAKDETIKEAIKQFAGLRVLRQDPWETTISYLCSATAPVFRIRKMIESISNIWGEQVGPKINGQKFFSFPSPESLANVELQELRGCGVGFRDKRIVEMAKAVINEDIDFNYLKKIPYIEARSILLDFLGIGPKIADCILAFGLNHWEAFPTDVWIRRIVSKYYLQKEEKKTSNKEVEIFGRQYFGNYSAIAQEYLFHLARTSMSTKKISV